MNLRETREALSENVVTVTTTIWQAASRPDVDACAENAAYLFDHGVDAVVLAGGVGEHDRLTVQQQTALLEGVAPVARQREGAICLGTGLGRTVARVRQLAPVLGRMGVDFAMLMPPPIDDPEEQFAYYDQVICLLRDQGVWSMPYIRPEHPLGVDVLYRLFERHDIPGVKLGNSDHLPAYARLVHRLGHERSAWLCGVAGWWMPAYYTLGVARGMSSGIANAFPERPRDLLARILSERFCRDETYWVFVRIEELRRHVSGYGSLVVKYMQELVGIHGGMDGDGSEMPQVMRDRVRQTLDEIGWL